MGTLCAHRQNFEETSQFYNSLSESSLSFKHLQTTIVQSSTSIPTRFQYLQNLQNAILIRSYCRCSLRCRQRCHHHKWPASFVGIQAGRALNITWADAEGPVTLTLKTGEANALTTVSTIASGLSGTSYAWAIPSTLPESFYALQIDDSSDVPNYSVRFEITGGPAASSSSASGSSTSTGSSSSASATSG